MPVEAKVFTGALTADSTPTSFTSAGFGTAQVAIVFVSNASVGNNPVTTAIMSVGIWDGTRQYAMSMHAQSGSSSPDTSRYRNSNRIAVIKTVLGTTHTTVAEYTLSAVTDGVELALSEDGTSLTRYATVILLKGLDNARVGTFQFSSTDAIDVTDPGFKPSFVLYVNAGSTVAYTTTDEQNVTGYITIGVAHCSASDIITQHSVSYASVHNVTTSVVNSSTNDDCIGRAVLNDAGTLNRKETISAFDASGFSVTPTVATTSRPMYLAIQLADPDAAFVGIRDSKTSTGTQAYTGLGFEPLVLGLMSTTETVTNGTSTTPDGALMIGVTDGTAQQALNIAVDDGASSAPSYSAANTSNVLDLRFDTSGAGSDAVAAYSSFDADGFTLNYSTGSSSARKILAWAIGDVGSPPSVGWTASPGTQVGQVGSAFSYDLSTLVTGASTPFSYAVHSGSLPAGLSLNSSTGVISGTPTTSGISGPIVFRATAADTTTADATDNYFDIGPGAWWTEYTAVTDGSIAGPRTRAQFGGGKLFIGVVDDATHQVNVHMLSGSTWTSATLRTHAGPADYHNNPSMLVAANGYVHAASVNHGDTADIATYKSASTYAIDFGSAVTVATGGLSAWYPHLVEYDSKLWLFVGLGADRDISYKTSSDGGATWDASWTMVFEGDAGQRPYWFISHVDGELVMAVARTNPDDVASGNSDGYFLRFNGTTWSNAGGTAYTLPVTTSTGQVFFDSSVHTENLGFMVAFAKDSTGRFVAYALGHVRNDPARSLYMCRYASGSWSETELTHPLGEFQSSTVIAPSDPYTFWQVATYGGVRQVLKAVSTDSGATWVFTRHTNGAATNLRANTSRIWGKTTEPYLIYTDQNITGSTTWVSNVKAPFNALTGAPTLTALSARLITATSAQPRISYS